MCKEVKFRDAARILKKNGFQLYRIRGSHHYYVRGKQKVMINLDLNPMVWLRIKKENNLRED